MAASHSDDRHASLTGGSVPAIAWVALMRDFDRRVDHAVAAHVDGDSGKIMRAWRGFDKLGDYPVMIESVHRKLEAKGVSADLLDERSPHLASVPDAQLAPLALKMREASASRSPDDRDFMRNQRLYVTKQDLSDALAAKPGAVGPSPIGTMLSNLGDGVAFHVPPRASKEGSEASPAQTFKGREALEKLLAGFGKGALRSVDVPLNPVHSIAQRRSMDPFNPTELDKAIFKGWEEARSRMIGVVVADHVKSRQASKEPRAKEAQGASR